jgi:putative transposase
MAGSRTISAESQRIWASQNCGSTQFEMLPKRWIVERSFGWLNRSRRLSKDYELYTQSSEAMIYGSFIRLMTRRLAA